MSPDAGSAITAECMKSINQIFTLFKKDLLLEIRQQYSFYGVLLYIGATIFVLYMTIEEPEANVWNGLFWVIQLFISINVVAKSFLQESRARMLYFYSIVGPTDFVLSKLLFNSLLMLLMSVLSLLLFSLFLSNPIQKSGIFIGIVLLGGWSLSLVFTFLAAIAAKAQQNAAIMAILALQGSATLCQRFEQLIDADPVYQKLVLSAAISIRNTAKPDGSPASVFITGAAIYARCTVRSAGRAPRQ